MCASQCSGQWAPVVDTKPCGEVAASDATSAASAVSRSIRDGSTELHQDADRPGLDSNRRRITSTRTARLARRVAVAANRDLRNSLSASGENAVHKRPDSREDSSRNGPVVVPQQKARPVDTPKPKSSSALSKNAPAPPSWVPSSCGVSGSTCGGSTAGAGSGNVLERTAGAEQEGFTSPSPAAIKREAESRPEAEAHPLSVDHPPGWVPSSCGFSGGTCGGADGSGGAAAKRDASTELEEIAPLFTPSHNIKAKTGPNVTDPRQLAEHPPGWSPSSCGFVGSTCGGGSGSGGPASIPTLHATKREAESQPAVEARSVADNPPGWTPMSCTIQGVTCGKVNDVAKGADDDSAAGTNAGDGPPAPYDN